MYFHGCPARHTQEYCAGYNAGWNAEALWDLGVASSLWCIQNQTLVIRSWFNGREGDRVEQVLEKVIWGILVCNGMREKNSDVVCISDSHKYYMEMWYTFLSVSGPAPVDGKICWVWDVAAHRSTTLASNVHILRMMSKISEKQTFMTFFCDF